MSETAKTWNDTVEELLAALEAAADSDQAASMAAYMKTDASEFLGVPAPLRQDLFKSFKGTLTPRSREEYEGIVLTLWQGGSREAKYLACLAARQYRRYHRDASMPMFERMIVEGAWWDTVDTIATYPVGGALRAERERVQPKLVRWLDSDDMWLRRSAILSQLRHGRETDASFLLSACRQCMGESEFFIRKAIGWALREYAKVAPDAVRAFVSQHDAELSGLSKREALRGMADH